MIVGVGRDGERLVRAGTLTVTVPEGEIVPLAPAVAVIVKVLIAKLAEICGWRLALLKRYVVSAPTDTPSTRTSATW